MVFSIFKKMPLTVKMCAIEDVLKIFNGLKTQKDFICMEQCDHLDLDSGQGLQKQIGHALNWFKQYLHL